MAVIGSSILSIARNALHAHQVAVQVTANNITNAETPGYSRQRALLNPGDPVLVNPGWLGTGVSVADVSRLRDSLLDVAVRRESAGASGFGVRRDLLAQVETALGEPSENGLAAGLDAFWSSWADLANDPASGSARAAVQQNGARVASLLNGFDRRLADLGDQAALRFEGSVGELNGLLGKVADLNERIMAAEVGGQTAGNLRDLRDSAVDEIAKLADVRVLPRQDGTYGLVIGGSTVVDGNQARMLRAQVTRDDAGRVVGLAVSERSQTLVEVGGLLGGAAAAAGDIASVRRDLDRMAAKLVEHVNGVHQQAGEDAPPIFDPERTTARSIRLSAEISADPGRIAAGRADVGSTDNSIALELAAFRETPLDLTLEGEDGPLLRTFADFYRDTVTGVGFRSSEASRDAAAAEALTSQAELRRQSVSGVSVDEELILLMRHQQAYTAATRLVSAADEMMKSIIGLV
jgi:flagellar hook-associated protein 1